MVPNQIRHYQIGDPLGSGGMGAVYKARDLNLGRDVALKLIRPDMLTQADILRRFRQEVEVLKDLEHSAIVPVYDFGGFTLDDEEQPTTHEPPFMVMRFMAGGTLHDRLKDGPLSPDEAGQILKRIAAALDAMHANGLIHRDLKPRNIFFDSYGDAYLGDFGLVKAVDSATSITGAVGTYAYMSPEQFTGREISPRSDVYALGGLLFTMLSGKRPYYQHTTLSAIMDAHRFGLPPDLRELEPHLPRPISQIIQQAMAKDPDHRFGTAQDMATQYRIVIGDPLTPVSSMTRIQPTNPFEQTILEDTAPPPAAMPPRLTRTQWMGGIITVAILFAVGFALLNPFAPEPLPTPTAITDVIVDAELSSTNTPEPTDAPPPATVTLPPTPIPTYPIFVSRFDSSAIWELDGTIQTIPDDQNIPVPQGKTIRLQSDREQLVLNLPGLTELHMLQDTELEMTAPEQDNEPFIVNPLEGRFAISAISNPVEITIAENMTATIIGGQIGISRNSLQNRVEVDCLNGRCDIQDGANTRTLNTGEQYAVASNGQEYNATGIDYTHYLTLALQLPTPTVEPTLTPTVTPTPALSGLLDRFPRFETIQFGESVSGQPLEIVRIGNGEKRVLFVGGIHAGYHADTVTAAADSAAHFISNLEELPSDVTLYVILNLNPDSIDARGDIIGRLNANGVDLNRNWDCRWQKDPLVVTEVILGAGGSEPASEPESQAFQEVIETIEPVAVVFWGSSGGDSFVAPGLCAREDGPSVPLSAVYAEASGYDYPTPPIPINGSLTGDISNWLDAQAIPSAFVLLSRQRSYDFGRELDGIQAVIGAISEETLSVSAPAASSSSSSSCRNDVSPPWQDLIGDREAAELGCATTDPIDSSRVVYQTFDTGLMFWREDNSTVYALINGGGFQEFDPPADATDRYLETNQLRGAIGFVWNNTPAMQTQLGDPIGTEQEGGDFLYQEFEQGYIYTFRLGEATRTFVLIDEGQGQTRWLEP